MCAARPFSEHRGAERAETDAPGSPRDARKPVLQMTQMKLMIGADLGGGQHGLVQHRVSNPTLSSAQGILRTIAAARRGAHGGGGGGM